MEAKFVTKAGDFSVGQRTNRNRFNTDFRLLSADLPMHYINLVFVISFTFKMLGKHQRILKRAHEVEKYIRRCLALIIQW